MPAVDEIDRVEQHQHHTAYAQQPGDIHLHGMCGHERKDALFRIFPVQIGDVPAVPFGKDRSLLDHDEPLVRADQRLERRTVDIVQRNMPGTERQYRIGKCNRVTPIISTPRARA